MTDETFLAEFARIKEEIEYEALAKTLLHQIEVDINDSLAFYKSTVVDYTSMHPFDIHTIVENEQLGQGFEEFAKLGGFYEKFVDDLEALGGKQVQKSSIRHKVTEEFIYLLLAIQYFKTVSRCIFTANPAIGAKSVLVDEFNGLILLPKTIQCCLGISALDYSDYLLALLRLTDTIVDFTTSCIIKTSISNDGTDKSKIPFTISVLNLKLLTKTLQGFQLLDLKNDNIRRKFDGLKYNVKKVNEIVYDLSLRGLIVKDYELN